MDKTGATVVVAWRELPVVCFFGDRMGAHRKSALGERKKKRND